MRTCLPKSAAPAEQVSTDANARTITGLRVEITLTLYSNTGLGRPITAHPETSRFFVGDDEGRILLTRKSASLRPRHYLALAGGTMPFIRRYSTIWP
jgi:hypothetical protein